MIRRTFLATALAGLAGCTSAADTSDETTERPPTDRMVEAAQAAGVDARTSQETNQGIDLETHSDADMEGTIVEAAAVAEAFASIEYDHTLAVMVFGDSPVGRYTIMGSWAADYREGELTHVEYLNKIRETMVVNEDDRQE